MKTKEQIINDIKQAQTIDGMNSMGISESFYNPYYLLKEFMEESKPFEQLEQFSERELNLLLDLAKCASDVFY